MKDGIHELRVKLSGNQVRVFYFFCYRDFIVLTNVLMKTTAKVPESKINDAKKCRDDFLKRIDEEMLRELVR